MCEVFVGSLQVLRIPTATWRLFVRYKSSQDNYVKRWNKENKLLFGPLLETKKEKTVRMKREKNKSVGKKLELNADSELAWIMGNTGRHLKKLTFLPSDTPKHVKKIFDKNPKTNSESNLESRCSLQLDETTRSSIENAEKKNSRLADVLIRKLTSFSIFDASKKITAKTKPCSQIISISQYDYKERNVLPSVTRILSATMSPESKLNLELWKQRKIQALGEKGFEIYSKELLQNGKQFHSAIQNFFMNKPIEVPKTVQLSWDSVQNVLKDVRNVEAVETHAVHSKLQYRGIVDCVGWYRGNLCVIDWKMSEKLKETIGQTFDAPLQVASYIGALNADQNYPFEIKNGLVVVAYTNGNVASVHELDEGNLQKYWRLWLRRLQKYYQETA